MGVKGGRRDDQWEVNSYLLLLLFLKSRFLEDEEGG